MRATPVDEEAPAAAGIRQDRRQGVRAGQVQALKLYRSSGDKFGGQHISGFRGTGFRGAVYLIQSSIRISFRGTVYLIRGILN